MDVVYQKRIGNFELVIKHDDDAPSPRDAETVLGRRYAPAL